MNVTFLIGNGFDINLGLDTRYSDFYPYFIKNASSDNMIRNWISKDIELWADLEEKLGEEVFQVKEDNLEQFYADKEELDLLLIEYLEKEQNKMITTGKEDFIYKTMVKSMNSINGTLSTNDKSSIASTMTSYASVPFTYEFISFNYTNTLDRILSVCKTIGTTFGTHNYGNSTKSNNFGSVLHIHGTTDEEMILGVNDPTQVNNDLLKKNTLFLNTFIKGQMNNKIGQGKVDAAGKIIDASHIICIFGMSIGNTDKMWWQKIMYWLSSNEANKLIIFVKGYNEKLRKKIPSSTIRLSDKLKTEITNQGNLKTDSASSLEKIKDRIMISYNSDIFTFPDLIKK